MSGVAWPELALADLLVVLLCFGPALLLGVPKLLRTAGQPAELAAEPLLDEALTPAQRRWLAHLDRRFAALGHRPAATLRVTNVPHQAILARLYASPADPARAAACALADEREGVRNSVRWLAFSTCFADGSQVSTVNLRRSWIRRRLAGPGAREAPGNEDPVRLFDAHQRHRAPAMQRGPRFVAADQVVASFHEGYRREVEWMCTLGWYRRRPDGAVAPTLRGALWMALDTFLPIGDGCGPIRAALGLACGALAAAVGALPLVVATVGFPLAAGGLGLVTGAAVVGTAMPGRAVFWAPLAVWAGLRIGASTVGEPGAWNALVVATIATVVAQRSSNLVARMRNRAGAPPPAQR